MKTKSWKKYMCLMGISLMMMPAVCAMQTAEGGNADNPVKKTRSTTFISGEKAWDPAGEGVTRQIMGGGRSPGEPARNTGRGYSGPWTARSGRGWGHEGRRGRCA